MLCLSRKKEERIVIRTLTEEIWVTITDIRGDKVRLGFEADPNVAIHREEVDQAIRKERGDGRT